MKKLLILFLLASVMLSMCSGCTVEKTVESAQAVTVLKVIKPNYISDFTQNIAEFNESKPRYSSKIIDAPTSTEKRHQLYVSALSGKTVRSIYTGLMMSGLRSLLSRNT